MSPYKEARLSYLLLDSYWWPAKVEASGKLESLGFPSKSEMMVSSGSGLQYSVSPPAILGLTHHSPRSQPQLRTMFVYYALLFTLTPTPPSLAANPARMSSSWVRLMSPVHRFVTCHLSQEEIQRVEIFGWWSANNLYFIRQVKERGNMPNKCKRAGSLPRCDLLR